MMKHVWICGFGAAVSVSVLMIANPDILWSIEHSGQPDRQQPTEKYISTMRIAGSICMVLDFALFVMFLR